MSSNIKSPYRTLEKDRVHQGDIFYDFKFPTIVTFGNESNIDDTYVQYGIILSQDCDLEGAHILHSKIKGTTTFDRDNPINGNKFLPSIIIAPAFLAEDINTGEYLLDMGFKMATKGNPKKSPWKTIKNNNDPRYHYIKDGVNEQLPDLIIDFKIFYTLPYDFIYFNYDEHYECSLNELLREDLSQRFFNYHSRIGLPVFKENEKCKRD